MRLPHINTKSPVFIPSFILGLLILITIFVPQTTLKKFFGNSFNNSQFAAAFSNTSGGDWNDPATWGITSGTYYFAGPGFSLPQDVTVAPNGNIYVADSDNERVVVLDTNGNTLEIYPVGENAYGIALASDGKIYIAQADISTIKVLNANGTAFTTYTGVGDAQAIRVATSGKLYIADSGGNQIIVLNPNGTPFATYSGVGLNYPRGLAISSTTGEIYVANRDGNDIVILNADGTASTTPPYTGGFNGPFGVALSPTGDVYVADTGNDSVVVLNPDGSASTTIYTGLNQPHNLTITPSGKIYIADTSSEQIILIDPNLTPIEGRDYPGPLDDVNITGSNNIGLTQNQSAHKITLANPAILDLDGNTLNVYGDWLNTGGTLDITNGGTVNFAGAGTQSIFGANTFYSLNKLATTTTTFLFDPNNTTTITGSLTLNGSAGNLLSLAPIGVNSGPYLSQFGSFGFGNGLFSSPQGIAIDSVGNIYVTDSDNNRVQKFDSSGNYLSQFGSTGSGNGEFSTPTTIAISPLTGNIYVVDSNNTRVEIFNSAGVYQSQFGSSGSGPGQFFLMQFSNIAINSVGDLYITDPDNRRVEKFTAAGVYLSEFGTFGTGDGQFLYPIAVAIDSSDNIYVTDDQDHRVQKFSSTSAYILQFGSLGTGDGQFYYTDGGITIDSSGNIYVVDELNNRVEKFNPNGVYLSQFGSTGSGNGEFNDPVGITTDQSGHVYVVDTANNRIQKFDPASVSPFNIIGPVATSSISLSYLSVLNSINLTTSIFDCTNNCVNQGGNTNWLFPTPSYTNRRRSLYTTATSTIYLPAPLFFQPTASTTTPPIVTTIPIVSTTTKRLPPITLKPVTSKPTVKPGTTQPTITTSSTTITEPSIEGTPIQDPNLVLSDESLISDSLLLAIQEGITQTYLQAIEVLTQASQTIEDIINSPTGGIITKVIATVGIVLGTSAAIASIAFASPISFSEIGLIPTRTFGLLLGALGIRKKQRPWGTVYDSITKRPLDPAYVTLIDTITGKEVGTAITDLDGRYSFSALPGIYKLVAAKTNYTFPSIKMSGRIFDELYNDLYFGTTITITSVGDIITKNIPMDPQAFDWNEFAKNKSNINTFIKGGDVTWAKISRKAFVLGFVVSLIALFFAPAPYNIIITSLYAIAYILNYFVFKVKKPGTLRDKTTHLPLSFAIVKIFREGMMDTPMIKKIADKEGKYYALLPKGNYSIQIDKKNDDGSYTQVYKSDLINFNTGVVNQDVEV